MRFLLLLVLAVLMLIGARASAIVVGQLDDFQNGTLQGWTGGATPSNVASGGPAGSGDRYLEIDAANGKLGTYNRTQWTGNYSSAGVGALRFALNNAGPDPVAVRISVIGPTAATAFTTANETVLPAQSGWVLVDFALDEASLTRTSGTATLAQTLASVTKLLLRHDPDPISPPGESNLVSATLGIDNVTALPEPGSALLLASGLTALASLRRACRRGW